MAKTADGDGDAGVNKYQQIVDDFQRAISAGQYKFNDQLPTEAVIMDEYSVSRPTAHRAMVELEARGLVEVRRGVGTFVRIWKPILRPIVQRMSHEVWGAGQSVWSLETEGRTSEVQNVRVQLVDVPAHVAAAIGEARAWLRRRTHLVDERPVMLSVSYYPDSIVAGSAITQTDTGPGGAPARLAELGHAAVKHTERFRIRQAAEPERGQLKLPKGSRVVEFSRQSRDAKGRVVEVTEMVAAEDAFVFQVDYTS